MHIRDVARLLSKIAIENKFPMAGDINYDSKPLTVALMDIWVARYPSKTV